MIVAATGHRAWAEPSLTALYNLARFSLQQLVRPDTVISGMALGWDIAVAKAAMAEGIPVIAAVPFAGQEKRWPQTSRDEYENILRQCKEVRIVSGGSYSPRKMHLRNQWMVNKCDLLLAFYDEEKLTGGTAACVAYANKIGRKIYNVYSPDYFKWLD